MAKTTSRTVLRAVGIYGLLVVVPVLLSIVLLTAEDGGGGAAPKAEAAAGHPLAQLLLAIAAVVAACKAAGWLMRRMNQPRVIGEVAAGIVLGPSVLGAAWPAAASTLIPSTVVPQLNALAQVGVVLFVFLTGLEFQHPAAARPGSPVGGREPRQHRGAVRARRRPLSPRTPSSPRQASATWPSRCSWGCP